MAGKLKRLRHLHLMSPGRPRRRPQTVATRQLAALNRRRESLNIALELRAFYDRQIAATVRRLAALRRQRVAIQSQ